jgi:hypothetical protein
MKIARFPGVLGILVLLAPLAGLMPAACCDTNAVTVSASTNYPSNFLAAARLFKLASPTNRLDQANQLYKELPACPVDFQYDTGIGIIEGLDYSKPSFLLSTEAAKELLGSPSVCKTNAGVWFTYVVAKDGTDEGWALKIQFEGDYAVYSIVVGPSPPNLISKPWRFIQSQLKGSILPEEAGTRIIVTKL